MAFTLGKWILYSEAKKYVLILQLVVHILNFIRLAGLETYRASIFNTYFAFYLFSITFLPLFYGINTDQHSAFFIYYEVYMFLFTAACYFVPFLLPLIRMVTEIFDTTALKYLVNLNSGPNLISFEYFLCQIIIMVGVIAIYNNYVGFNVTARVIINIMNKIHPIILREITNPIGLEKTTKELSALLVKCQLHEIDKRIYSKKKLPELIEQDPANIQTGDNSSENEKCVQPNMLKRQNLQEKI